MTMNTIDAHLMQQAGQYKQLPSDEQRSLAERAQAGDKDARDQLVLCNLRLVLATMKTYQQFLAANFDDLYQAGIVGLLKAIDHYDASFGAKFSSYAVRWINQSIRVWIFEQNTIYAPRYIHDAAIKVYQTMRTGCHDVQELAAQTELEPAYVERAMQYLALSYISIDTPVQQEYDAGYTWAEIVPDEYDLAEDVEQAEQAVWIAKEAKRLLAKLTPRERTVIDMRFGLTGHDEMKLSVIARRLGMSQSLTSHVYQRALCKMQRAAGVLVKVEKEAKAS